MSIRRCPYCKAIIEEGAEYCSNCGTQLLFPDDELIEEEIPGEKVLDEEKDQDEPDNTEEEIENEAGDEAHDQRPAEDDDIREEKKDMPEAAEIEDLKEESAAPIVDEEEIYTDELDEDREDEEWGVEEVDADDSMQLNEKDESLMKIEGDEHLEGTGEDKLKNEEVPSNSAIDYDEAEEEIENLDSAELEKREIDKFISSIRHDRGEDKELSAPQMGDEDVMEPQSETGQPDHPDDSPELDVRLEEETFEEEPVPLDVPSENDIREETYKDEKERREEAVTSVPPTPGSELFKKEDIRVSTDHLPPWASKIKDDMTPQSPLAESEDEREPLEMEEKSLGQEETAMKEPLYADTGVGLPEGVSQHDLPFSGDKPQEKVNIRKQRSFQLAVWLRSRAFDILLMALIWLITVWIASSVMQVGLFRLIGASALLLGIYYAILLAGYFFLFFFFLGETLGDYVFNERKKTESRRPA